MRIYSKFKDYYDSARGYGIDPNLVYDRQQREINLMKSHLSSEFLDELRRVDTVFSKLPSSTFVVFFCGKIYPVIEEDNVNPHYSYFYDTESYERFLERCLSDLKKKKNRDLIIQNSIDYVERRIESLNDKNKYYARRNLSHRSFREFKEQHDEIGPETFRYLKSPVFLIRKYNLEVNPCLRSIEFQKQFDPYTAFQEISMYIGNQLTSQMDPDIKRSDELIRDSKGMDEWSFRKIGKKSKVKKR